jgi:hypothetical protein
MLFGMSVERRYVLCSCGIYLRVGPSGDRPVLPPERGLKVERARSRCEKCAGTAYDAVTRRLAGELPSETRARIGYYPGTRAARETEVGPVVVGVDGRLAGYELLSKIPVA